MFRLIFISFTIFATSTNFAFCSSERWFGKCPGEMVDLGVLDGTSSARGAEAKVHGPGYLEIPPGVAIDYSYKQTSGNFAGGSANPVMTIEDMPAGVYMEAYGNGNAGGGCIGWSVSAPVFEFSPEGKPAYKIVLYCHSGSSASCIGWPVTCAVSAHLCVKGGGGLPPPRGPDTGRLAPGRPSAR